MRWLTVAAVVVVLAAGVGGVAAWRWWWAQTEQDRAIAAAEDFVTAWQDGDADALGATTGGDDNAVAAHERAREELAPESLTTELVAVDVDEAGEGQATARYDAHWDLGALGSWTHTASLQLRREEDADRWGVAWTPTALHADLGGGQRLDRVRAWPDRAPITDADGAVLVGPGDLLEIGVEPRAVDDAGEVAEALAAHTDATAESVSQLLERDDLQPDWFYPVAELPADAAGRDELASVPGVVVRDATGREVTRPALAPLLGTVGEITAEQLEELGAPYETGDTVGASGVERVHERELAGEPGGAVRIVDDDGQEVAVLHEVAATEPDPLAVTLDADVQQAADTAMADVAGEAALVAVDVDDGGLLAAVDRPVGGFPRWRAGGYAPGSTFKVVTATALLAEGLTPESTVACPATITVEGRPFRNAGGLELGSIPFAEAFAESCNTAFIGEADALGDGALVDAAAAMGFGERYSLIGSRVAADFPEPADDAGQAAQAIGQGRISVAPAHMASVAAAAASGTWRQPHVVVDDDVTEGAPLPQTTVDALASMMRRVVTDGTGTAADVAGRAVRGKTGTAEVGGGAEHAWFIGHSGDVAFAVLVEDGGAGGTVAAPIAAEFVAALR